MRADKGVPRSENNCTQAILVRLLPDNGTIVTLFLYLCSRVQPYVRNMARLFLTIILSFCLANCWASTWQRRFTTADGLQNNQVRQIVQLPNGQVLVATEGAFSLYNGREFVAQPCNLDSVFTLPVFGGHSCLWQGDSLLWLKDFYSLYLYDAHLRRFRYDYEGRMSQALIKAFVSENGDSLTRHHVEALDGLRPRFASLVEGTPMKGEWLQAYARDRQGGEWFGAQSGGLLYVSPRCPAAQMIVPQVEDAVRRVVPLDAGQLLMAGGKGVYVYDLQLGRVTKTLLTGNLNCSDISADGNGRFWLSTQQGLLCYDHGQTNHFATDNATGFLHSHIRFSLPLADGRLLVCNLNHHLGYFYPAQKKFVSLIGKLPELKDYRTAVAACKTDNPAKVIVCTQNGLFVLDTQTDETSRITAVDALARYSKKYNCILRDRAGRTWIGTQNGLLLMEANGDVRRIDEADGLSNTCIQSMVEDPSGRLWVGTSCGINRICIANGTLRVLTFGLSDGVPQTEMEERGACMAPDGTAYFVSKGNIMAFQTQKEWNEQTDNTVCLVALNVMGNDVPADENTLHLDYNQNYLRLKFSALNYATPEHTRYRYRMKGIDADWLMANDGKGLAEVNYNALPPGTYLFEAQAQTGDGEWGQPLEKSFVIHPPLWLTWWAKLLYALTGFCVLVGLMAYYLKRRKAKLERENDAKVNQLFELRDAARHQFAQSVSIEPEKIAINKEEETIVTRLMAAIENNMDNVDYTVDQLAQDAAMSRTDLYRKTQQMLGITPNNFLRNVRLKQAARLLAETDTPVNQVALMVGFQTPRYFSQCFRQVFGVNPMEYRNGKPAEQK